MTNSNLTPEQEKKQELLNKETDILAGVLGAVKDVEETVVPIAVIRDGVERFRFHVTPQKAEMFEKANEASTVYKRNKRGAKLVDSYSVSKAHAYLILHATTPEDRAAIWENKELRTALNEFETLEVVQRVLLAGEMDAAVGIIEEISGYSLSKEDMMIKEREKADELKN